MNPLGTHPEAERSHLRASGGDAKAQAIATNCGLLLLGVDLIIRVRSALGQCWESERSPLDGPRVLLTGDPDCDWWCHRCREAEGCRVDEPWVRCQRHYRQAYRLEAITRALEGLTRVPGLETPDGFIAGRVAASAVWCEYADRWLEWNPEHRRAWAWAGALWMAAEIPGPVPEFHPAEARQPKRGAGEHERLIAEKLAAGWSYRRIRKHLGGSFSTIAAVAAALKSARGGEKPL